MTRRVLVVDDEPQIRTILRAYLQAEGFEVMEAATGADALNAMREAPDLVLLDLGLPDIGGLEVLAKVRAASDVYVICVTARAEEVDKLVGLSVGADDYITKPFSPREVVARVLAVLRRHREEPVAPGGPLRFEGLTLDPEARSVVTDDGPVDLTALDFDPERFVDFYAQKGWMIGRSHMKDWKATVRNWVRTSKPKNGMAKEVPDDGFSAYD